MDLRSSKRGEEVEAKKTAQLGPLWYQLTDQNRNNLANRKFATKIKLQHLLIWSYGEIPDLIWLLIQPNILEVKSWPVNQQNTEMIGSHPIKGYIDRNLQCQSDGLILVSTTPKESLRTKLFSTRTSASCTLAAYKSFTISKIAS